MNCARGRIRLHQLVSTEREALRWPSRWRKACASQKPRAHRFGPLPDHVDDRLIARRRAAMSKSRGRFLRIFHHQVRQNGLHRVPVLAGRQSVYLSRRASGSWFAQLELMTCQAASRFAPAGICEARSAAATGSVIAHRLKTGQ